MNWKLVAMLAGAFVLGAAYGRSVPFVGTIALKLPGASA